LETGTGIALTLYRAYDADMDRWLSEDPVRVPQILTTPFPEILAALS
jgi:hypothetical protein